MALGSSIPIPHTSGMSRVLVKLTSRIWGVFVVRKREGLGNCKRTFAVSSFLFITRVFEVCLAGRFSPCPHEVTVQGHILVHTGWIQGPGLLHPVSHMQVPLYLLLDQFSFLSDLTLSAEAGRKRPLGVWGLVERRIAETGQRSRVPYLAFSVKFFEEIYSILCLQQSVQCCQCPLGWNILWHFAGGGPGSPSGIRTHTVVS